MNKQALCIASVASNLDNFNRDNVNILLSKGYEVTLAANFNTNEDVNSKDKIISFKEEMINNGVRIKQIDFSRNLFDIRKQVLSFLQVKQLLKAGFSVIHCHSPICSVLTRIAAIPYRKHKEVKVIYTAHGFHFYKGAPIKNWLLYYPIEKILSRFTDVLITINHEDYIRATKSFYAKRTLFVHGIGINTDKFSYGNVDVNKVRKELGLKQDDIMLLSVGELSLRKNQSVVIRALGQIGNSNIHYYVAGIGQQLEKYQALAHELKLDNNIHFLGYRTDISELCQCADVFVFPSLQEGLPVALMEAIASKTTIICSDIRGNSDLISDKRYMFDPKSVNSLVYCIEGLLDNGQIIADSTYVDSNYRNLLKYSIDNVHNEMETIYDSVS